MAVACAVALAALPLARASDAMAEAGVRIAAIGVVALIAAVVLGWPSLVPLSLVALGGLYAAQLAIDDKPLDAAAPLLAAGVLVTAELAYWSIDERDGVKEEPGETLRRVAFVALLGLATLFVAATLLTLVDAVRARGLAVDLIGAAAAAAALLAVVAAARSRDGSTRERSSA